MYGNREGSDIIRRVVLNVWKQGGERETEPLQTGRKHKLNKRTDVRNLRNKNFIILLNTTSFCYIRVAVVEHVVVMTYHKTALTKTKIYAEPRMTGFDRRCLMVDRSGT
jgi:hypothetical protein